jgi:hypothetical protein
MEATEASRRTLVRAALHTAWAVPAVSLATAAPALAAASGTPLRLDASSGSYWVKDWTTYDQTFGVVPHLTITNATSLPAGLVTLSLEFPVLDFIGPLTSSDPPSPSLVNLSELTNNIWTVRTPGPKPGDSSVLIEFTSTAGLAAGASITLASSGGRDNPGSIDWTKSPTASVPFVVSATDPAIAPTTGSLVWSAGP